MMRWLPAWVCVLLLSACNPAPFWLAATPLPTPLPRRDPTNRAIRMLAPVELPDTAFVDQDGALVHLSDLRGRVTMIVFTNIVCVEDTACMQPLPVYQQVKRELGARATDVAFVFVGVDPKKDTAEALNAHVRKVDASFLGWTGPTSTLRPLTLRFGIHMNVSDDTLLAHAPFIYLLDKQTRLRVYLPKRLPASEILPEIEWLLGE